jgi:DNA polymerase III epsilon subunit-like protein
MKSQGKRRRAKSYIVVDLETGGTDPAVNPILEVALVCLQFDETSSVYKVTEELSCLVKPYKIGLRFVVEESALAINKLTLKTIEEKGNDVKVVVEAIKGVAEALNPGNDPRNKPIFVGHNIADFDLLFLEVAFKQCSSSLYHFFRRASGDTYLLVEMILAGNEQVDTLSLGNVCSYFGIQLKNSHTALADARANAQLFLKILNVFNMRRNRKEYLLL